MSSGFVTTFNGNFIRIDHPSGYEISEKSMAELWRELARLCREHGCLKVLSVIIAPRRNLSMMNSFESGSRASELLPGVKLACCFFEYEADEQTEFFKNVAYNRGAKVEFFNDEGEALRWLGFNSLKQENPGGS